MAIIAHNNEEVKLLARLMRAEAESDGKKGMLCVGNVAVNRALAKCYEFKNVTTVYKAVTMQPGGFEATYKSYFYQAARKSEIELAKRILNGEKVHPATNALWFYNPHGQSCRSTWYGAYNTGKYKSHCFYTPPDSAKCY
ncbi:MAG: cell wall hydrolase [Anaeroplasma sp.]|nr:cell wall hydrolase [Anaeroplasma sp.]